MEQENKEIIKLTAKEVLRYLEGKAEVIIDIIDSGQHPMAKLLHPTLPGKQTNQPVDWKDFRRKIQQLKQRGLIRKSCESKKYHIEITDKGRELLERDLFRNMRIERPAVWDKKWRVVMYDIPEKDHIARNAIRGKLTQIGFEQIQKSVFVYPFDCAQAINIICQKYGEMKCLKYLIADIIEGEEEIVEAFLNNHVLHPEDLSEKH